MDELFDLLPDAVIVVGPDRAIEDLNGQAERLTGWSRADAIGKPYGDVCRLRDAAGSLVHEELDPFAVAPRLSHGSPERHYMLYRADGSERPVTLRATFVRDDAGAIVRVIAALRDGSRRHLSERSAYDLIATLAHDLRSPLTSVKGFTSTMRRNWERFTDEQKLHMLTTIDWDADRMNRLLKDLLDLSRLEAGRLEVKKQVLDLAELATQVAERIDMDAKNHAITSTFPEPFPKVVADPGKVEQVLVNLVENAVRHADPGPIAVTGEADDERVTVRVADAGPGIAARHVPYVFTKFYRKGTGERHSSGTGLGLYICKGIIEAHGGEIAIERTDPSGTVFAFWLPAGDGEG
ncbi:MAG TPA: ATP-binding protein [Actinomycetota bacterium]